MKTLIAYASRYGSTKEIANYIGKIFDDNDIEADVLNVEQVKSLASYETVVLGSAVYAGNWLKEGKRFIDRFEPEINTCRVWLFSSGPVGKNIDLDTKESVRIYDQMARTNALDHRVFAGKIDPTRLNFAWRAIMHSMGAVGDFRNWEDIGSWAKEIIDAEEKYKAQLQNKKPRLQLHKR